MTMFTEFGNISNVLLGEKPEQSMDLQKRIEGLNYITKILSKEITNYIKFGNIQKSLTKVIKLESDLCRRIRQLNIFEDTRLNETYNIAILKTFIAIIENQDDDQADNLKNELFEISQNTNLRKLLSILYQNDGINHGELAERLSISKNALTNMIKKTEKYKLYTTEKNGRYKYYYANNNTRKVYREYLNKTASRVYTPVEVGDIISIVITTINQEIKNSSKLNANSILDRISISNKAIGIEFRKDIKHSVQNLTKNINEKTENNYLERFDISPISSQGKSMEYAKRYINYYSPKIKIESGEF